MYDARRMFFGLLFGLLIMRPISARAEFASTSVVISEVAWAGSARSASDEWLELTNRGLSDVNVGGWFMTGTATSGGSIEFAPDTMIPSSHTLLIANYKLDDDNTTLAISPDLVTTAVSLPNDKLDIVLAMPDGQIVDELHDAGKPDFGSSTTFASMERQADGTWATAITSTNLLDGQLGTPGVNLLATLEVTLVQTEQTSEVTSIPIVEESVTEMELVEETAPSTDGLSIIPIVVTETQPEESQTISDDTVVIETAVKETPIVSDVIAEIIANESTLIEPTAVEESEDNQIVEQLTTTIGEIDVISTIGQDDALIEQQAINEPTELIETVSQTDQELVSGAVEEVSATAIPEVTLEEAPVTPPSLTQELAPALVETCGIHTNEVIINELFSRPDDGPEWIELKSFVDHEVTLTGCSLRDASQKLTALNGILSPFEFLVIENPVGKLNNDQESVELIDESGLIIDSISYGNGLLSAPRANESLGWDGSSWLTTNMPTPGIANLFTANNDFQLNLESSPIQYEDSTLRYNETTQQINSRSNSVANSQSTTPKAAADAQTTSTDDRIAYVATPTKRVSTTSNSSTRSRTTRATSSTRKSAPIVISINDLSDQAEGRLVTLEGDVVALPDTFGHQIMYLNGLELYMYSGDWPELSLGDHLKVSGTTSLAYGNHRLKLSSSSAITTISHTDVVPIEKDNLDNLIHGELVHMTGLLERRNGATLLQLANGEEIELSFSDTQTGGALPGQANVTGVMRMKNGERSLALRSQDDLVITPNDEAIAGTVIPNNVSNSKRPFAGLLIIVGTVTFLALSYVLARKNKHRSSINSLQPTTI